MTALPSRRDLLGPMVHLRTVPGVFHARVIAARLGADGILTELRGAVGGPYPFGAVSIWVATADEPVASDLLLADEVEAAFDEAPEDWETGSRSPVLIFGWSARRILAAVALVAMITATMIGRLLT